MNDAKTTRTLISNLNQLDLDTVEYQEVRRLVQDLYRGVGTSFLMTEKRQKVFRARAMKTRPNHLDELRAPPANLITSFQRCNSVNEPRFYCTESPAASLLEIDAAIGDLAYVAMWVADDGLAICDPFQNAVDLDNVRQQMFNTFIETSFLRRVVSPFSNDYKITAAITAGVLDVVAPLDVLRPAIRDRVLGITETSLLSMAYPSYATAARSTNLAMRPDIAEALLRFSVVEEVKVTERTNRGIKVDRLAYAVLSSSDEDLTWIEKGISGPSYTVTAGPPKLFTSTADYWSCVEDDGIARPIIWDYNLDPKDAPALTAK